MQDFHWTHNTLVRQARTTVTANTTVSVMLWSWSVVWCVVAVQAAGSSKCAYQLSYERIRGNKSFDLLAKDCKHVKARDPIVKQLLDKCGRMTLTQLMSWVPSAAEVLQYNGSSPGCVAQTMQLLRDAEALDLQALHMLDSWAKIPSGLLQGNVNQLGDYDQCVGAGGRYCLAAVDLRLPASMAGVDTQLHAHYAMTSTVLDPGHRIPKFSLIHWAVCVPAVCSSTDVQQALVHVLTQRSQVTAAIGVDPDLCSHPADLPATPKLATICAWIFFITVFLLCLLGTVTEMRRTFNQKGKQGRLERVVNAFCVRRNVHRLLDTTSAHGDVRTLHGVRALNAFALLLSHKQMALLFLPFINRTQLAQLIGRSWSMVGRTAILYTDSFILLSGLLTTLSLLRQLSRTGRINLADFALSRFIRLTPSLAALIVFCTLVLPGLGSGPLWGLLVSKYATLCQHYWWRNLLYVHNHFPFDQMCLTHSHQVAIDMQLYLTAPLLVYAVWWRPRWGLLLLLGVAVWSSLLRYTVALSERLSTVIYFGIPISQLFRTAQKTYILPSHRATVYCLGIALGYFLHHNHSYTMSRVTAAAGWVLGVACGLLAMFAPFHMSWPGYVYSTQEAALYNMLAPFLWSVFIGWLVFASHYGYAGWFGRLLSWRWFVVFTRLSYAVYLTQFPLFFYNVGQVRTAQQYSIFRLLDWSEYSSVLLASAVLTVMFDLPAQNLKTAFFSSSKEPAIKLSGGQEKAITEEMDNKITLEKVNIRKRLPG